MVDVGVSVGVAVADCDGGGGCTFDYLLGEAGKAMYEVEREGKNGYAFWGENNMLKIEHISLLC